MGVRGLKTFFERENQTRIINIGDEINIWKKSHPGQKPILVIDFLSLTNCIVRKDEGEVICGGRHAVTLASWRKLLDLFKSYGASLVFFSDLSVQKEKVNEWLDRRDGEYDFSTEFFDWVESGLTLQQILERQTNKRAISATFHGMTAVAKEYGEFHYAIRHECDLEIAQYAKNNKAMAVITTDTDFLIFEGPWRFWSSEIRMTRTNRLTTVEYNRNGVAETCSLSPHQLPLFATLLSNDHTHGYFNNLARFYCSMGPMKFRIKNVARFVRKHGLIDQTDESIQKITQIIFGASDPDFENLVRQSLNSYKTDFPPVKITDPLEQKLLGSNMYKPYMENNGAIQGIAMTFYDMRGCEAARNFPIILADWIKRRKGILQQKIDKTFEFTLLAKMDIHEKFMEHTETVVCPDFDLPPLDELYVGPANAHIDTKWTLLGFIMGLSDETVQAIRNLPNEFRLIATVLYALVKHKLIGTAEADGILYAEYKVSVNEAKVDSLPVNLVTKYIRTAHLYNIAFSHVRQNFAIAGLLPLIQECLHFDGVYYQNFMESVITMNSEEKNVIFEPIQRYKIY